MSSCKILTIQLPSPPSSLYQNLPPNEENAESSIGINVHIQWKVKSGSIVHKGETIASLSYILAGDTPSESNGGADDEQIIDGGGDKNSRGDAPRTGSSGAAFESTNVAATEGTSLRSLIRARMKRRWAGGVNPSTTLSLSSTGKGDEKRGNSNGGRVIGGEIDGSSKNRNKNYAASIQIRSPSNGFLRVQQTSTMIPNAFPLKCGNNRNNNTKEEKDKMILAIVEPCRHPAVVGDLCAVCGYDFKSSGHEKDVIDVDADYTNSDTNGVGESKSVDDRLLIDLSSDDDIDDDDEEESMRRRNNHSKQSSSGKRHFDSSDIIDLTEVENNDATSTADAVKDATTNSKLTSTHATTISASAATDTATSSAIESTTQTKAESNSSVSASNALGSGAVAPKLSGSTNLGPPAKATNMRSLSSLLSGVESTRQMQQTRHSRPRPASTMTKIGRGHNIISPSPQLMSSNSNPNSNSTSATNPSTSIPKMTQMTVSGGITVTISESEAKSISEASSKKLRESKQLCLVMDLDHTLLHATDDYRAGRFAAEEILLRENDAEAGTTEDKIKGEDAKQKERQNRDREKRNNPKVVPNPEKRNDVRSILLPVDLPPPQYQQYLQQKQHQEYMLQSESKTYEFKLPPLPRTTTQQRTHENTPVNLRHYVKLRPHLKEFFEQIQSKYKLSVYTAGTRAYAEQIAIMICRHLVGTSYDEEGLQLLRAKMRELDQDCKKFREYKAKLGRRRQLETARQRGDFMETDLETIALEAERESMEEQGITEIDGNKGEEKKNEWNVKKAVTLPARKQKGKYVSFAVNLETETKESALRIRNNAPSEGAASDGVEAKPKRETKEAKGRIGENEPSHDGNNDSDKAEVSSVNEGQPTIGASESNLGIDTVASSTASSSSSTSIKRNNSSRGAELSIPRKKKRPVPPSLLPLVPPPAKDGAASNKKQGVISSNSNEMDEVNMKDLSEERDKLRKKLDEAERLEIAAVDLRRKIFGSRIVSRTDVGDLGKDVKSLKRVFPCGGVMAAIIDDREDVWANANNNVTGRPGEPPDNLLLVKPYHWKPFSGYADVNNASGNDLSKKDVPASSSNDKQHDVEEDVQLLWTADVLKRLHERYFSSSKAQQESEQISVPSVLRSMRKEVLQRHPQAKIVFSGLIPISKQNIESPVRPHVVRYAEELGAEVLPDVTNQTTHIVAARDGSEKIQRARRDVPGCFIVHTSWLMECYWSLTRRDVINHHMGPMPKREHVKSNVKEHETTASRTKILIELDENESEKDENDDDDEEDDGFAADLESEMMKGDSSFLC